MKELQRKQRIKRILYSIPSLIILSIATFILVRGAFRVIDKKQESSKRVSGLEEKAVALTFREQELKEGIARLQTEEGIKNEIKERFSVTEEGEHVAIIVDERRSATSTGNSKLPWYKKFWNAIMGRK